MNTRLQTFVHASILALIVGWVLYIGKSIFVPIVFSMLVVYVMLGITRMLAKTPLVGTRLPLQVRYVLAVVVSLSILQFFIGNFLDPYLMGNSLNLSPFVILVSLTVWAALWGIAGAFLAIPITAVMAIILFGIPRDAAACHPDVAQRHTVQRLTC